MNRDKVLIFTNKDDPHTDGLIDLAIKQNVAEKIIRVNTEDILTNTLISFNSDDGFSMTLKDSKRTFNDNEILSVWYRRPEKVETSHLMNLDVEDFVQGQISSLLIGVYIFLESKATFISPLFSLRKASFKLPQLMLAKQLGFKIPKSIISNSIDEVELFFSENNLVSTKSIDSPNFYYNGVNYPIYNRKLKSFQEIKSNSESISICPTYFQEFIEKQFDLRVIVIGKNVFAFKIESQNNEFSMEDFRGLSADLLSHSIYQLKESDIDKILKFTEIQNLNFSAMDFVINKDNELIFLENNPNGQWMWLEYATKFPLTEKMLNYLLNPT
jgi:glutathione synthase/RimK-type ligase-like ATP-grasp enzyme